MKLDISEFGAFAFSTLFASFFVISVYIWKPITRPPLELLKLWQKRKNHLKKDERTLIDEYEIKMRIRSVGTLCGIAFIFLCIMADST